MPEASSDKANFQHAGPVSFCVKFQNAGQHKLSPVSVFNFRFRRLQERRTKLITSFVMVRPSARRMPFCARLSARDTSQSSPEHRPLDCSRSHSRKVGDECNAEHNSDVSRHRGQMTCLTQEAQLSFLMEMPSKRANSP